jgi:hypothetical protein
MQTFVLENLDLPSLVKKVPAYVETESKGIVYTESCHGIYWARWMLGFDSRHYQNKKKVVGLERGPLSLVSTTEKLLDRKVAAPA